LAIFHSYVSLLEDIIIVQHFLPLPGAGSKVEAPKAKDVRVPSWKMNVLKLRCLEAVDPKIIQEMVILCHIYIVGNPLVWR
jgi:hypothetical protein